MGSFGHRLVIGPGGSGTSHRMAGWLAELHDGLDPAGLDPDGLDPDGPGPTPVRLPDVVEVRGDPVVPVAPGVLERLRTAAASGDALVVAHDVHWLSDEVLVDLVHAADQVDVWASRRPWPVTDLVRALDDRLTVGRAAERLGPLTIDELAPVVAQRTGRAAASGFVEALHRAAAGFVGPACDALDEGWGSAVAWDDVGPLPEAVRDRLLRRVGRAGAAAAAFVRVIVVDPAIEHALADRLAVESVPGTVVGAALRAASAGGLLDSDWRLVPLVARAVRDDLTEAEQAELHERLAAALAGVDRERAVDHAVAGAVRTGGHLDELLAAARAALVADPLRAADLVDRARAAGADPTQVALLEAELHLRAGRSDALAALGRVGEPVPAELALDVARLRTAVELRAGRWDRVAVADVEAGHGELGSMRRLAELLVLAGRASPAAGTIANRSPLTRLIDALVDALDGRRVEALRHAVEAADDEVAGGSDEQLAGVGISLLVGLLALTMGELATADSVLARSIAAERPVGEIAPTRALHRYVALRRARPSAAAPIVSAAVDGVAASSSSPQPGWARDLLLQAASDAAVARRTGDPVRLREAWSLADPVLVRVHPSWLFVEPLTELLVTGARLGRTDRVQPVIDALHAQVGHAHAGPHPADLEQAGDEQPGDEQAGPGATADGAVPAAVAWAELHLALAVRDLGAAAAAVERLRSTAAGSAHARARVVAGDAWVRVAAGSIDEAEVTAAVEALLDVDEGWEAARLAGQAALDAGDPMVTRRLLERARAAAPDPAPARRAGDDEDGLVALGLSEREAEVARLVADGRTYKEIGAELYISAKTVEHHVARIRQKLGADTRSELLAAVREHGSAPR